MSEEDRPQHERPVRCEVPAIAESVVGLSVLRVSCNDMAPQGLQPLGLAYPWEGCLKLKCATCGREAGVSNWTLGPASDPSAVEPTMIRQQQPDSAGQG